MSMTDGIFILSSKSDDDIIDDCQKLLRVIKSQGEVKFLRKCNEYSSGDKRGFKVILACSPKDIEELIKRKFFDDQKTSTIQCLTTTLTIEDAFPQNEKKFMKDVVAELEKFVPGKVIHITKIQASTKHPEISTGKWIILLNVPEVEDLPVFIKMGLPEKMFLRVSLNNSNYFHTRFYCRLCGKDGHVQRQCGVDVTPREISRDIASKHKPPSKRARTDSASGSSASNTQTRGIASNTQTSASRRASNTQTSGSASNTQTSASGSAYITQTSGSASITQTSGSASNIQTPASSGSSYNTQTSDAHESRRLMPPCIRQIVLEVKNGVLDVDGIEAFINHSQNETNVWFRKAVLLR